jgi:hypothetical protein
VRLFCRRYLLFACFPQEKCCISGYLSGFHTYRPTTLRLGYVRFSDVFIVDTNQVWGPATSTPPCDFECYCWVCVAVHRGCRHFQAPFTRSTESPATGLPATGNTWQAVRTFTWSTLRSLPSTELASPFLFCRSKTGRRTGDSRTTQLYVIFQRGDSLHEDLKQIHVNLHKEFVSWIYLAESVIWVINKIGFLKYCDYLIVTVELSLGGIFSYLCLLFLLCRENSVVS